MLKTGKNYAFTLIERKPGNIKSDLVFTLVQEKGVDLVD